MPHEAQVLLILQSVLLGAALGAVYDVLRVCRWRLGRGATAVCDGLFWLIALAAFFEFNLVFAIGQSRGYVIAAVCGGAAVYFWAFGRPVRWVLGRLFEGAARLAQAVRRAVSWVRQRAARAGLKEKSRVFLKKFAKPSSIFRKKGIK